MAARKLNHHLDVTEHTAVMVCLREGCTWRGLGHSAPSAWRMLSDHVRRTHGDWRAADYARQRAISGSAER